MRFRVREVLGFWISCRFKDYRHDASPFSLLDQLKFQIVVTVQFSTQYFFVAGVRFTNDRCSAHPAFGRG